MALPGWASGPRGGEIVAWPLPVPHVATYSDEGAGTTFGALTVGGSTAAIAGSIAALTQAEAYGVVLLDWTEWSAVAEPPPPLPELPPVRAPTFVKSYKAWERIGVAHLLDT